jgi:hypothetical protein
LRSCRADILPIAQEAEARKAAATAAVSAAVGKTTVAVEAVGRSDEEKAR